MQDRGLARDEAGNVWEVDAQGNAVRMVHAAGGAQQNTVIAPSPYRVREEQRNKARDEAADARAADNAARSRSNDAISNPQILRKEYASLPEVMEYKIAAQMAAASLRTAAGPQGDLALVYSFAKAMDPGSVVRDQEARMVSNSQPWFQSAVEGVKKQFGMDGAGNFTPEARSHIRAEILKALASRKPLYEARRSEMTAIALANKIEPGQVIGKSDTDIYASEYRKYAEANGDEGDVVSSLIGGSPIKRPKAAGMGATESGIPIPPAMQQAHNEYLAKNWGHIDPQDYAAFRINLDKQYGFGSDPEGYKATVPAINEYAVKGGKPEWMGNIPAVKKELSGFDQFRNNMLSNPGGAGAAGALNAAGFGLPSLFAPEQMRALRDARPYSTAVGEIGGGVAGTLMGGGMLGSVASRMAPGAVSKALASPLAADIAYGAAYGATQADDPLYGAAGGSLGAFAGNRIGRAFGKAFPTLAGSGKAIRQADATVPSSAQLRDEASALYRSAEANGGVIQPTETMALADTTSGILSRLGRLGPTGRLTEVQPKVKEAYQLVQDYAGEPMTPTQVQTVRSVIGDGLNSAEPSEKMVAGKLLGNFDDWTDAVNPELASGLRDARSVASRYLQGDKIAQTRELADVRAGQFGDSGLGNALRTDFRQLDRGIAKGHESFAMPVEQAVRDVARGTPIGNLFRNMGRFAPTGAMSSLPTLALAGGGGAAAGAPGILGGLLFGGTMMGARRIGENLTKRSAQVAENAAYGGTAYTDMLTEALNKAAVRGGHVGSVAIPDLARFLADQVGR